MEFFCRLYFADRTVKLPLWGANGTAEAENCTLSWQFRDIPGGKLLDLEVQSGEPLGIRRIDSLVFTLPKPDPDHRIAFFGNNMHCSENRWPHELGENREYCTDCAGLFPHLAASGTVVAGVSPFASAFGAGVKKLPDGSLEYFAKTEFTEAIAQSCHLKAERVLFCEDITFDALYDLYAGLLPQSHFPMPKLMGWNTWDYYLDRVTPEDIAENVAALKKLPFADQLEYIVMDDGWQKEWGIWRENEKFACGLEAVANNIRSAGFQAGIWMAPLCARPDGTVVKEHPDWFLKNPDGSFFYDLELYYLDPTHPEVEAFILDNYRYLYRAGYRLFKIDYLSSITKIRSFHDKNATPYGAISAMIRRIIAATGDDVVILGCSLPIQCGADIAPAMRIAVDIHNHFTHAAWIAEAMTWACMYNGRVTRIDPDFMVVRGSKTADEPLTWEGGRNDFVPPAMAQETEDEGFRRRWRHGDQFNALEAETWANLVAVSGGNIFLSDRISRLNDRGIAILQQALDCQSDRCKARFLPSDKRRASVWMGDRSLVVVNWEDETRTVTVDAIPALSAQKPHTWENGTLTVTLQPHESFIAKIK